jgi:D-alanyl-lipoteichoic acid acyltransferase DltB (MBOAT superfamily)
VNFVEGAFLPFLLVVLAGAHGLAALRSPLRWQNLWLLGCSVVFYGWVHPWFLGLLVVSAGTDFVVARQIERRPAAKDLLLTVSLLVNLGLLGYFKYFNFFVENVAAATDALGLGPGPRVLNIVLPVGISFYTFQTMSYVIDVWRGTLRARTDWVDYFLYVMYFPQLVAGPIERADHLLAQLERPRRVGWDQIQSGVTLALWGAFQKLCVADTLAPYVDKVFVLEAPSGVLIWTAALGFSVQIYADFSGYTDIARGVSRLLGVELAENFRSPYLARSTPEFWQRWHMSLSTWIRDYVLVPLLGNPERLSVTRFLGATLATFLVMGFWHGASWNFVWFGAWHGAWFAAYTLAGRAASWRVPDVVAVPFHFVVVCLPSSLLFRETTASRLVQYAETPPLSGDADEWVAASVVFGMTLVTSAPLLLSWAVRRWVVPRLEGHPVLLPLRTTTWAVLALGVLVFYRVSAYDFVYFRF